MKMMNYLSKSDFFTFTIENQIAYQNVKVRGKNYKCEIIVKVSPYHNTMKYFVKINNEEMGEAPNLPAALQIWNCLGDYIKDEDFCTIALDLEMMK